MNGLGLRVLLGRLRWHIAPVALRLLGLTLVVTLAAAVPLFVNAAMDRALGERMQQMDHPLGLLVAWAPPAGEPADAPTRDALAALDGYLRTELPRAAGFPGAEVRRFDATAPRPARRLDVGGQPGGAPRWLRLAPLPGGLQLSRGRWPGEGGNAISGPIEAVASETLLVRTGLRLGDALWMPLTPDPRGPAVTVTLVGTVRTPQEGTLAQLRSALEGAVLIPSAAWAAQGEPLAEATWVVNLPPAGLRAARAQTALAVLQGLPLRVAQYLPGADVLTSPATWLQGFVAERAAVLRFLTVLLAPVFLLAALFIGAAAGALAEARQIEIAVLRSRGTGLGRVLAHYLPESLLLMAVAVAAGLSLAVPLVQLLGLSSGFLELVARPPLPVAITGDALAYAVLAASGAESVALVPLWRSARHTVATLRQEQPARRALRWAGLGLELTLAAVLVWTTLRLGVGLDGAGALPGWLGRVASLLPGGLVGGRAATAGTVGAGAAFASDPALVGALPVLGLVVAALLGRRLFGLVMAGLVRLVAPVLPPHLYLGATRLGHPSGRSRALFLMLVLTLGLGVHAAALARTLDRDLVVGTRHSRGADLLLQTAWEFELASGSGEEQERIYKEPPYQLVRDLSGVAAEARVQIREQVELRTQSRPLAEAALLALSPREFSQVAHFVPELLPTHPFGFLNALAREESAVLLSQDVARRARMAPGDRFILREPGRDEAAEVVVAGVVPFWPGFDPGARQFVVANLHYIQDNLKLRPYAVWLRMAPGASALPVYEELRSRGVRILSLRDTRAEVAAQRREPLRLGIYGVLSVGFMAAVAIMALSTLLAIGLTLRERARELGVARAMGLSARAVAAAVYTEYLVLLAAAAASGVAAGSAVARFFVPLVRTQSGSALTLPLPVQVSAATGSLLAWGLAAVMLSGIVMVGLWLRRLRVTAVLRLGEDL